MANLYKKISFLACLILFAGYIAGCVQKPKSTADVPRHLPVAYKISVAPFTQPLHAGQLITGHIPEDQGHISLDALLALDLDLKETLQEKSPRDYVFIPRQNLHIDLNVTHSSGQPSALSRWVAYGQKHGAQFLLVPQVLDWHERVGSQAGVSSSAHVRVEFYLINIAEGAITSRSIFEEKQVGLVENLLAVADFVKRKGQWISARQLAVEGMAKAVKDLGL